MFNRLQDLIDRIPSGLRRVIIAVIVLGVLAFFFPLQQDVNRLTQPLPPLTPTPSVVPEAGGESVNTSTGGGETSAAEEPSDGGSGNDSRDSVSPTTTPRPQPTETPRPSATPSPTVSPCGAEAGWVIYTVRPGDTLAGIAQLVGADVAELVECNDLANPNALRVNQQLFVPSLPSAFVTSTATPSVTPTPSITPTPRA